MRSLSWRCSRVVGPSSAFWTSPRVWASPRATSSKRLTCMGRSTTSPCGWPDHLANWSHGPEARRLRTAPRWWWFRRQGGCSRVAPVPPPSTSFSTLTLAASSPWPPPASTRRVPRRGTDWARAGASPRPTATSLWPTGRPPAACQEAARHPAQAPPSRRLALSARGRSAPCWTMPRVRCRKGVCSASCAHLVPVPRCACGAGRSWNRRGSGSWCRRASV
mmetsp:Transcript_72101/g.206994  ORF Transcript_72101/g.206994 Transcript_72101/m.206994 type:complete len:220 (-) Transcript_72101:141-800(-)